MAELTYNPNELAEGEFTAEEQDSLRVGEALLEQQEQLLAGKFKDAEDLEQAYIELQRKLGDPNARQEPEPEEAPEEEERTVDVDFLDRLWEEAHGEYTEETLDALSQMAATDVAQMYLEYRNRVESEGPQVGELSDADVDGLQGIVGGEQQYGVMMSWAAENLSQQEQQMYDAVMERGDPLAAYFAVNALAFRFREAQGYDGQMLTGRAPASSKEVFRSQAELVRAISDPRYDSDPAYRADVAAKLENSDLAF
jgi:hypothetical protein